MEEQWIRELKNEIETESAINVGFLLMLLQKSSK